MDDDIIDDLADALANEMSLTSYRSEAWAAMTNAIRAVAEVINTHEPTYDLRYFYKRAGHDEPYPIHPVR